MQYYLLSDKIELTEANTQGGVVLSKSVNADNDLVLGSCVASKIEFTLLDIPLQLANITGVEFDYSTSLSSAYTFPNGNCLIFENGDRYYFLGDRVRKGLFTATKPERIDDSKWKVVCYDRMIKFDRLVDEWYSSLTFPISLKNLLLGLCSFVGVELHTKVFTNADFLIPDNVKMSNVKGRDILTYICEIAASYAYFNLDGRLVLDFYKESDCHITKIISNKVSDYQTKRIDKLQVKAKENDIGIIVGTGTNAYIIQGNPFLFASSDAQIRPVAENIFNKIKDFSYTPFEIEAFAEDAQCDVGDIVSVTTRRGSFTTAIMSLTDSGTKVTLSATGSENRSKLQSVNRIIQELKGKTNEIIATVDEFNVTLTDMEKSTNAQFLIQADLIAQKVAQTDYNGNTISSLINQTAGQILISATALDLDGYATFSSLSGEGTTEINAGNLKTGTIDADVINIINLNADNITAGTISGDIIEGGTIKGSNMVWGDGRSYVEMGAVDDPSSGKLYAQIKSGWQLIMDAEIIKLNAGKVHIGEIPGTNYFDSTGNIFDGTVTFNYGLDVTGDHYLTTGNAKIGYLELSGKALYTASDGSVRWRDPWWS